MRAMKTPIRLFGIFFALLCLGLLPNAQAVNPPPDGVYPGFNTAEGQNALFSLTTGHDNTATGTAALSNNTTGFEHTACGSGALVSNSTGTQNTAFGAGALRNTIKGRGNVAVGRGALVNNTSGAGNVALGFNAGLFVTTANNVTTIDSVGANVDNSCFIGNIFGVTTVNVGTPVLIDSAGQLGTISSSRRFKHEIKPMDEASAAILALKPVTFRYRSRSEEHTTELQSREKVVCR